jgi:hypothetical protein
MSGDNGYSDTGIYQDPGYVKAASGAMRVEARKWDGFSDTMDELARKVAVLDLKTSAFSVLDPGAAAAAGELQLNYQKLHQNFIDRIREATEEFSHMARALRVSADDYGQSDRAAAARMKGVW